MHFSVSEYSRAFRSKDSHNLTIILLLANAQMQFWLMKCMFICWTSERERMNVCLFVCGFVRE
jgi:hypothetical protein